MGQVGCWKVEGDVVHCESRQDECTVVHHGAVYARPGLTFDIPVLDVICGHTEVCDAMCPWEYGARGLPIPELEEEHQPGVERPSAVQEIDRELAGVPFVDIDGSLFEVSS